MMANGRPSLCELFEDFKIFEERFFEMLVVDCSRGVVERNNFDGAVTRGRIIHFSVRFANGLQKHRRIKLFHNIAVREAAERRNDLRLYGINLPIQKWPVYFNLTWEWVAVF